MGGLQLMASPLTGFRQYGIVHLTTQQSRHLVVIAHLGSVQHAQASGGSFRSQPALKEPLLVEWGEWSKQGLAAILRIEPFQYPGDGGIRDYHLLLWGAAK